MHFTSQMENLTIIGYESGVGKCPFNPHSNITSLMSSHGNKMFVGTVTDFSGSDAAILRTEVQQTVVSCATLTCDLPVIGTKCSPAVIFAVLYVQLV